MEVFYSDSVYGFKSKVGSMHLNSALEPKFTKNGSFTFILYSYIIEKQLINGILEIYQKYTSQAVR